jgi:hypothetical protein
MTTAESSISSVARPSTAAPRRWLDGLIAIAFLSLLPLLGLMCSDFGLRSDFLFFILLLLLPPVLLLWRGRRDAAGQRKPPERSQAVAGLALWPIGGLLGLAAGLTWSPWLALASWTTAWVAWQITRTEHLRWPRLVKWTLPWVFLLVLPQGDRYDFLPLFAHWVTLGASSLLDIIGIAHLPIRQSLVLEVGTYDVAAACRGLGSPYLLFALAVLLCMSTRCSLVVGLLILLSVPVWAWGGSVLLVVSSVWLREQNQLLLWTGYPLWIAQGIVLILNLIALLLCRLGWQTLLAPFTAYSEGVNKIHRWFNSIALWPDPDPLRKRRGRSSKQAEGEQDAGNPRISSNTATLSLSFAGLLYLVSGGATLWQIFTPSDASPSFSTQLTHPYTTASSLEKLWKRELLPEELQGLQLVDFEMADMLGAAHDQLVSAKWTYQDVARTIYISARAPSRGRLPLAQSRQWDGAQPLQKAVQVQVSAEADGPANWSIEEIALNDPLTGRTYVAAIWWPLEHSASDVSQLQSWTQKLVSTSNWLASVSHQPTSINLVLEIESDSADSTEQKEFARQLLVQAAQLLQKAVFENQSRR